MKVHLMYRERDFDPKVALQPDTDALEQDLELETLYAAMSQGDPFLSDVLRKALLQGLDDPAAITYRQRILLDCIEHPSAVREVYGLAVEAIEGEKKIWSWSVDYPESVLRRAVDTLEFFLGILKRLRAIADKQRQGFRSEGLARLFDMVERELDDTYLLRIEEHLEELRFPQGVRMSARLGEGFRGRDYVLRRFPIKRRTFAQRVLRRKPKFSFEVSPMDESGHRALSGMRDSGVRSVAAALKESTDHILSFFVALRTELALYVGSLNLHEALRRKGAPTCVPVPSGVGDLTLSARGIYDVCLALKVEGRVVGNDLAADGRSLLVITGANQGGKSTFLRSLGLAYLMTQAGIFAPAERFSAGVSSGIFTHYRREEDTTMTSGKFDEELKRMSAIVDRIKPGCILLSNESFASTNEREGSEIGEEVVRAMVEAGVRVFLVTHLFELAERLRGASTADALFLRAERKPDGQRTFRVIEGEPQSTSHGEDLFRRIFEVSERTEVPQIGARH